jgi:hypothetical protein
VLDWAKTADRPWQLSASSNHHVARGVPRARREWYVSFRRSQAGSNKKFAIGIISVRGTGHYGLE